MARTRASLLKLGRATLLVALLGGLVLPAVAQTTATKPPATGTIATKPAAGTSTTTPTKPAKPTTAGKPAATTATKPATTTRAPTKPAAPKPAATTAKPAAAKPAAATAAPRPEPPKSVQPASAPVSPPAPLPPTQATPLRDTGPTPVGKVPGPLAATPPFLERHPVLGGFAAGLLGSSLAETLLGGDADVPSTPGPRDANVLEPVPQTSHAAETAGQFTRLALFGGLVYLGVTAWRRRAEETAPATPGLRERAVPSVSDWDGASDDVGPAFDGLTHPDALRDIADEEDFAEILRAVQSAWSEGNIALIRAHVTPEMADHYNDALAQNSRNGIESRVEQVADVRVERLRDWEEDGLQFAAARMRWAALDYLIDVAKTPDEPGYVVDGSADEPVECEETWTFVKVPDGAWVLTDVEAAA